GSRARQDVGSGLHQPLRGSLLLRYLPFFITNFEQRLLQSAERQLDPPPRRALLAPYRLVLLEGRLAETADLQGAPSRHREPFDLALAGIHLRFSRKRRYDIIFMPD